MFTSMFSLLFFSLFEETVLHHALIDFFYIRFSKDEDEAKVISVVFIWNFNVWMTIPEGSILSTIKHKVKFCTVIQQ